MTKPLSPAARAVLYDAHNRWLDVDDDIPAQVAAAALRAAADQVVPEECLDRFPNDSEWQGGFTDANERIRAELLAIAAELEGSND